MTSSQRKQTIQLLKAIVSDIGESYNINGTALLQQELDLLLIILQFNGTIPTFGSSESLESRIERSYKTLAVAKGITLTSDSRSQLESQIYYLFKMASNALPSTPDLNSDSQLTKKIKLLTAIGTNLFSPCQDDLIAWNKIAKTYLAFDSTYRLDDCTGTEDREIRKGRCYQFDGIAEILLDSPISFAIADKISININFFSVTSTEYFIGAGAGGGIRYNGTSFLVLAPGGSTLQAINWVKIDKFVLFECVRNTADRYEIFIDGESIGLTGTELSDTLLIDNIGSRNGSFIFTGKMGLIDYYASDTIIHKWCCNEESSNETIDSIGINNGTITNATLALFHAEDNNFGPNPANQFGYTNKSDQILPIKPDGLDSDGDPPEFTGRVKRGPKVLTTLGGDGTVNPDGTPLANLYFQFPDVYAMNKWNKLDTAVWGSSFSGTPDADKFKWTAAELLDIPNTKEAAYEDQLFVRKPTTGPLTDILTYDQEITGTCLDKTDNFISVGE